MSVFHPTAQADAARPSWAPPASNGTVDAGSLARHHRQHHQQPHIVTADDLADDGGGQADVSLDSTGKLPSLPGIHALFDLSTADGGACPSLSSLSAWSDGRAFSPGQPESVDRASPSQPALFCTCPPSPPLNPPPLPAPRPSAPAAKPPSPALVRLPGTGKPSFAFAPWNSGVWPASDGEGGPARAGEARRIDERRGRRRREGWRLEQGGFSPGLACACSRTAGLALGCGTG